MNQNSGVTAFAVAPELFYRPSHSDKEAKHEAADSAHDGPDSGGRDHYFFSAGISNRAGPGTDRGPANCTEEAADDRVSVMVGPVNPGRYRVIVGTRCCYVNRIRINADTICVDPRVGDRPRIYSRRGATQLLRCHGSWKDERASGEQQESDVHATRSFQTKRATIRTLT